MAADNQVTDETPVAPTAGVGGLLRETRMRQGRDLATAATALRIRQPYLLAIEEGRFQDLPGATYAAGFVRGYAEFLGLDSKEIVRRFKQENNEYAKRSELVFPSAVSEGSIPTGGLLGFAIIAAVVVYGIVYWYSARHAEVAETVPPPPERLTSLEQKSSQPLETASPTEPPKASEASPSVVPLALPSTAKGDGASGPGTEQKGQAAAVPPLREEVVPPSEEEAPAASPSSPVAAPSPPLPSSPPPSPAAVPEASPPLVASKPADGKTAKTAKMKEPPPSEATPPPVKPDVPPAEVVASPPVKAEQPAAPTRLQLRATESCWVEVRDSAGHVIMSRLLRKGEVYSVPDRPGLTLTAGNAGALAVSVDGKSVGPLGHFGVVRHDIPLDPGRLAGGAAAVEPPETVPPAGASPDSAKPPE